VTTSGIRLNPLTPNSAIWHYKSHCFFKNCNFLNRVNFALFFSCEHCLEGPSNWDTQKTPKVSDFCKILAFEVRQQQKWLFSTSQKNNKNHIFPSLFLSKSSLQAQKSTFSANFSPSPGLSANLFALIRYLGRATASHLVHTDLAMIFNIISALHAGK